MDGMQTGLPSGSEGLAALSLRRLKFLLWILDWDVAASAYQGAVGCWLHLQSYFPLPTSNLNHRFMSSRARTPDRIETNHVATLKAAASRKLAAIIASRNADNG